MLKGLYVTLAYAVAAIDQFSLVDKGVIFHQAVQRRLVHRLERLGYKVALEPIDPTP